MGSSLSNQVVGRRGPSGSDRVQSAGGAGCRGERWGARGGELLGLGPGVRAPGKGASDEGAQQGLASVPEILQPPGRMFHAARFGQGVHGV